MATKKKVPPFMKKDEDKMPVKKGKKMPPVKKGSKKGC